MSEWFENRIDAATQLCAVYGFPVRHSASPAMQNAGLAALKLNWRYLAFEVAPSELQEAIRGAQAMRFVGLNLTLPHKVPALQMMDALDDSARTWGAVNTIRFEGKQKCGNWRPLMRFVNEKPAEVRSQGFNTDADALSRAITADLEISLPGAKVLLLGAGGAGRVAALKVAADGVGELYLVNRTGSKAEALAAEVRDRFGGTSVRTGYPPGRVDLVLNATSLGLRAEDPLPWDQSQFALGQAAAAFDLIYRRGETPFLGAARGQGCRIANGLGMLLYQGAAALELWTGQTAPIEVMRAALRKHVYES